jgi:flagellar biogenesis protein FliO
MDVSENIVVIPVDEEMLVVNITTESFSISSTLVISERLVCRFKILAHQL